MGPQRTSYVYTAFTMHYKYSTVVYATSVNTARVLGLLEARRVMGGHARIHRDAIEEQP